MAKIISIINLKGGVGKTTTTVGLAEILSKEYNKRVLVIDLDAQTNATTMLIGENKWLEVNNKKQTIAQLFYEGLNPYSAKIFDINKAIIREVSNVNEVKNVDLLPSSLELIDIQEEIVKAPSGSLGAIRSIDILHRAVANVKGNYDYILVDCPPNLSVVTRNGLRMADGYIIPTIPDILSTFGIPQIVSRVKTFGDEIEKEIRPLGIVIAKYRKQSGVHKRVLKDLGNEKDCKLFKTIFKECDRISDAAEFKSKKTIIQKWGSDQAKTFKNLAMEIIECME